MSLVCIIQGAHKVFGGIRSCYLKHSKFYSIMYLNMFLCTMYILHCMSSTALDSTLGIPTTCVFAIHYLLTTPYSPLLSYIPVLEIPFLYIALLDKKEILTCSLAFVHVLARDF